MAQVSFLVADLPTRDSSLQISSYPKQEDLAMQSLLSDREKVVDVICRPPTCKRRLPGTGSLKCESAP
jgi:hypothetical protein